MDRPNDLAELLHNPQIAKRWVSYLDEIRGQDNAGIRESQFQNAHGYLRVLVDAELLSKVALTELRETLIKAAARCV